MSDLTRVDAKNGRWYLHEPSGVYLPSVTNILSVWPKGERFARWLGNAESYDSAIAKRDEAGSRGTYVHNMVEQLLLGETITMSKEDRKAIAMVKGFQNWFRTVNPSDYAAETFVVNTTDGYAGTSDLYCLIDGARWVVDVKTSADCYTQYHIQTAAYAEAHQNMGWPVVERRGVLLLKATTAKGWQMVESTETQEVDYRAFLAAKEVWHRENGYVPVHFEADDGPETVEVEL